MRFFRKKLQSWLGIYTITSDNTMVNNIGELEEALKLAARPIGSLHSYNRIALHRRSISLGPNFEFMKYNEATETLYCGAGAKVKDVMNFLKHRSRKLINCGNHREQTMAGVALTTHGFGLNSMVADSVVRFMGFDQDIDLVNSEDVSRMPELLAIVALEMKTEPVQSYNFTSCVCKLDDLKWEGQMACSILPYSSKSNPVSIISKFEINENNTYEALKTQKLKFGLFKNWRLNLWWFIDCAFPVLRRIAQKTINFIKIPVTKITTNPDDIDFLYHPWPSTDSIHHEGTNMLLWSQKPTYTCFNLSFCIDVKEFNECIKYIIKESDKIDRYLLRCFIGCRFLDGRSDITWAYNHKGPVVAIDLYCTPKKHESLIKLVNQVRDSFDVILHKAKSVV